jgi:hypothetical protein
MSEDQGPPTLPPDDRAPPPAAMPPGQPLAAAPPVTAELDEFLARAVDRQIAEQRALRDTLQRLSEDLSDLTSRPAPTIDVDQIDARIKEHVDEMATSIAGELRGAVAGVSADVEGIAQALIDLNSGLREWADGIDHNLTSVLRTVESVRGVANDLREQHERSAESIRTATAQAQTLNAEVLEATRNASARGQELHDEMLKSVETMRTITSGIQEQQTEAKEVIQTTAAQAQALNAEVLDATKNNATQLQEIAAQVQAMTAQAQTLTAQAQAMNTEVLEASRASAKHSFEVLETTRSIADETRTLHGQLLDTMRTAAEQSREVHAVLMETLRLEEEAAREAELEAELLEEPEIIEEPEPAPIVPAEGELIPAPVESEIERQVKETIELSLYLADQIEDFDRVIGKLSDLPTRLEGVISQALKRTLAARSKLDRDAEVALDEVLTVLDEHAERAGRVADNQDVVHELTEAQADLAERVDALHAEMLDHLEALADAIGRVDGAEAPTPSRTARTTPRAKPLPPAKGKTKAASAKPSAKKPTAKKRTATPKSRPARRRKKNAD